jgi:predicted dehydrogenase
MRIDVAIIGSGRWGRNHVNTVNQNSEFLGIQDIYVCDIDAKKLIQWEDESLKCFTSIEELLVAHNPSFAVVATPPETHFEITQTLLEQGIGVLVEKPIAANLSDAELLIQQAKESNCVFCLLVFFCAFIAE